VLTHQLADRLPGDGGLGAAQSVSPAVRDRLAPDIAAAFGHTFWWSAGIVALAVIPALLLPRHKPAAPATPEAAAADDEARLLVEV
jgi:hypothetical protein